MKHKNILDKIISYKKEEVKKKKKEVPLSRFKSKLTKSNRNFKKSLQKKGIALIAEIKKASPSEGIIRKQFNVEKIAKEYEKNADAISVLTDKKFFKGSLNNLKKTKKLTTIPLLRKDFIIDPYQIYEARHYGADAILLIASCLSDTKINSFIALAKKYRMDCLVEVHNSKELQKVLKTNAEIIGINNRDLKTFKVDVNTTIKLSEKIPKQVIVSESGIKTRKDIKSLERKANAVLIGTTFMREKDISKKIKEILNK